MREVDVELFEAIQEAGYMAGKSGAKPSECPLNQDSVYRAAWIIGLSKYKIENGGGDE